jgi:hypothetical protein
MSENLHLTREVDEAIEWYAKRHHLSPALLHAIIKADAASRSQIESRAPGAHDGGLFPGVTIWGDSASS